MLIIFHGNDAVLTREQARNKIRQNSDKQQIITLEKENFIGEFEQVFFTQSFFGETQLILGIQIFDIAENKKYILDNLEQINSADNLLILAENKILAADSKKIKSAKIEIVEVLSEKKAEFNTFVLADLLAQQDKKNLWLSLMQAKQKKINAESICGILLWQLKTLLLAKTYHNASEAGIAPFSFNKAKALSTHWSEEKITQAIINLTQKYHEAHLGQVDLMNELEFFCLNI